MNFWKKAAVASVALALMGAQYNRMNPVRVGDMAAGTDGELHTWGTTGSPETVAAGSAGEVLKSNGAGAAPTFERIAPMVIVVDEKAQNTQGGTFTGGAWQTRDLNTLRVNDDTIASLASDQITLPAGTYECWISAPAFDTNQHMIRLRDTTADSNIATGTSALADATNLETSRSHLETKFVLSVSSVLEVQHRGVTTQATNGFGIASNLPSTVETYTTAMFRKVE